MRPLEIYIHIPFCARKCLYCDFLSFAADKKTQENYVDMLKKEIMQYEDRGDDQVSTVFFGGGTPSLLPAEYIADLLGALRERLPVQKDAEITVECNPGTLDADKLKIYRQAGVSRISLGLQSAQEKELRLLGRIHTWEEFCRSFFLAREAGFSNINVDLMSALPGQTPQMWEDSLKKVLALRPEHISAYSLIIEEGTPFYERYGEDAARREQGLACALLPSEEEEREMYVRTQELLRAFGYRRYEISNYALPGYECRHNCGYWERREYRGFGLGAASLMDNRRFLNTADLDTYLAGQRSGPQAQELTVQERMEETMFLGLRMTRGVSLAGFEREFGTPLLSVYGETLGVLQGQGLLEIRDGAAVLTERGTDLGNYVMAQFLF